MKVDLHTHSNASDGTLPVEALIDRAIEQGVGLLSITDHDTLAAYQDLPIRKIHAAGMRLIPGIELSTYWRHTGVHIVGLNVQLEHPTLCAGVVRQQRTRLQRIYTIIERLNKLGLALDVDRVLALAQNSQPGRPHIAEHLVELGRVKDANEAFDRYLGAGKPGDVKQVWAALPEVVSWIVEAGGTAVLAHPLKYKLTRTKLCELLDDFRGAGGRAMEVVSGRQKSDGAVQLRRICREKQLLASCGSDFHRPGPYLELGQAVLPEGCSPVWADW